MPLCSPCTDIMPVPRNAIFDHATRARNCKIARDGAEFGLAYAYDPQP